MFKNHEVIKNIKALAYSLAFAGAVMTAPAAALIPGGGILAVGEVNPVGATTLFSTNVSWTATTFSFSGSLTSSVLTNDASNPFGGLTFTYQFFMDSSSGHSASGFSVGNYDTFLTDVSYLPGTGKNPFLFGRSDESLIEGDTVQFSFIGQLVPAGTNSALLVIQTDATQWQSSIGSIIDSQAVPDIASLAPLNAVAVIPEPTSLALVGMGLATIACFKRRQNS